MSTGVYPSVSVSNPSISNVFKSTTFSTKGFASFTKCCSIALSTVNAICKSGALGGDGGKGEGGEDGGGNDGGNEGKGGGECGGGGDGAANTLNTICGVGIVVGMKEVVKGILKFCGLGKPLGGEFNIAVKFKTGSELNAV